MSEKQNVKEKQRFWFDYFLYTFVFFLVIFILLDFFSVVKFLDVLGFSLFGYSLDILTLGNFYSFNPTVIVLLSCLVIMVYRAFFYLPRRFKTKKSLLKVKFLSIFFVIFVFGSPFPLFVPFRIPGYKGFTYAYRINIRKELDIKSTQDWLKTVKKPPQLGIEPNKEDLPVFLKKHYRKGQFRLINHSSGVYIITTNGTHWGTWGFIVGSKELEIKSSNNRYVLPLEQGAYVWHEIQNY